MRTSHTELNQLAIELELIAKRYSSEKEEPLFNISHWDADEAYHRLVSQSVRVQTNGNRFDYEFSQTLPSASLQSARSQLGLVETQAIQITPSGTSANLLALAILKRLNKSNLIIIGPCYFQVPLLAQALGIDVIHLNAWSPIRGCLHSMLSLQNPKDDAIWITNPVYCFGTYYSELDQNIFVEILESGFTLIADECNSLNGCELGRKLSCFENFIGTYAPHKGVCINGLKFGLLATARLDTADLNYLGDAWVGPLPRSIRTDMAHFTSQNFTEIKNIYTAAITKFETLITAQTNNLPLTLHDGGGHFRVVSFNKIPNSLELSCSYLEQVFCHAGASFIPMALNYGPDGLGFSFRINILREFSMLIKAIQALCDALVTQHRLLA